MTLAVKDGGGNSKNLATAAGDGGGGGDLVMQYGVKTNAYRNAGVLHRSAITAADKLAAGGTVTISAVTEAGSTLTNAQRFATICPGNRWGPSAPSTVVNVTPTANQAVRLAWAQVTGADYYDIFLSLANPPAWVGRVTEAERAAGGFIFSSVGTKSANSAPAGSIDVGIDGTGVTSTANPFANNIAYTPATPTPIVCTGYSLARLKIKINPTDLRSLPSATLLPFFQDQTSTPDWFAGNPIAMAPGTAAGTPLEQEFLLETDGATNLVILLDAVAGQGTAVSVWVDLA